jgi:hypothetical protein
MKNFPTKVEHLPNSNAAVTNLKRCRYQYQMLPLPNLNAAVTNLKRCRYQPQTHYVPRQK